LTVSDWAVTRLIELHRDAMVANLVPGKFGFVFYGSDRCKAAQTKGFMTAVRVGFPDKGGSQMHEGPLSFA
jgi:hypothetical protein